MWYSLFSNSPYPGQAPLCTRSPSCLCTSRFLHLSHLSRLRPTVHVRLGGFHPLPPRDCRTRRVRLRLPRSSGRVLFPPSRRRNLFLSTRLIPLIIERDVRVLFSDAFLVAIMFANFAIDLFVTAATFGRLVTGQGANYFLFIAPGSNLITAMVAAFQSGRDVWREKYIKDLTSYLL